MNIEKKEHKNHIEIKLLPNRRFIYSNRRSNIVLTAEHHASDITVLFPEEYEDYSKRVDFVNSQGQEWTIGLYTPEFNTYDGGFHRTRFHFSLPTEVTTTGELKMQFLAYKPDKTMKTVPFEVIPIDILDGVFAFKKNARSNPDLLILAANKAEQALFNSQRALGIVEQNAVDISQEVEARETADEALSERITAEHERATAAEQVLTDNLAAEIERSTKKDNELTESLALESTERKAADSGLRNDLNEEIERATEAERTLSESLAAESARAKQESQGNSDAIAAEVTRAKAAEQVLSDNLAAEVLRSTTTDQDHDERLDDNALAIANETMRSIGVEAALASALAAETQRSLAAEELGRSLIELENARALAAEADLQEQITDEVERATSAEGALSDRITAENARATTAEASLRADLNSEIARATTAEQLNAAAIAAENQRATAAENALGVRIDTEVSQALADAKAFTSQAVEQVRIDGTIYRGIRDESDLPTTGNENGDLYWISNFDLTKPTHSGSAIWNGRTNSWDFNIDRFRHADSDTIVARASDGALMVSDTVESNLTPDTTDFAATINQGDKAFNRSVARKIRGQHQRATENATAITAEVARATQAESTLAASIATESTRAQAAEQVNANAIAAEVARSTAAENNLSSRITAETNRSQLAEQGLSDRITQETARAISAEQTNASAITAETTRSQAAEAALNSSILAEQTRSLAAEGQLASAIAAETSRSQAVEQELSQRITDAAEGQQSDWGENDDTSPAHIRNRPTSMPASDVHPWAKAASPPTPAQIGAEPAFSKNTAFNRNFGTAANTVCQGNDTRLSNARTPTAHNHDERHIRHDANNQGLTAVQQQNARTNIGAGTSSLALGSTATTAAAGNHTHTPASIGAEPAFTKNTAFNRNFGTAANTVCEGNDTRLSNARTPTAHDHDSRYVRYDAAQTVLNDTQRNRFRDNIGTGAQWRTALGAEPSFTKNTAFNRNFGSAAGTVTEGNDSRLSNSRTPTSHASTATTFGEGTAQNYGHVRLSSSEGSTSLPTGDAAVRYNYQTAPSGIDLNTFTFEGRITLYNVPVNGHFNFPPGWETNSQNSNTGYLEVRRFFSNSAVHQTLYKRNTRQRWVRTCQVSSWSAWQEVDQTALNAVPSTRTVNGRALSANITINAADIPITQNANLGNATTLQAALNYIANVFAGSQRVTRLRAGTFDAD